MSGLLIGYLKKGSVFHSLSCLIHKCKCPVKSTVAAKIPSASEEIDEGKQ